MENHSAQPPNHICKSWHGKPYYSLDAYCKNTYGEKLYKISLDAGLTCPNRDGTLGERGCIFCSAGGSGDFAAAIGKTMDALGASLRQMILPEDLMQPAKRDFLLYQGKRLDSVLSYISRHTPTPTDLSHIWKRYTASLSKCPQRQAFPSLQDRTVFPCQSSNF